MEREEVRFIVGKVNYLELVNLWLFKDNIYIINILN